MKSKVVAVVLSMAMVLVTACGSASGDVPEATTEAAENASETVEDTEAGSQDAMTENTPYAETQGLTFSKLEPLSLDYTAVIVDKDYNEIKDDPRCFVAEKDIADYSFYDVITYPAEQDGYTTAEISLTMDFDILWHFATLDDYRGFYSLSVPQLFDYYSGQYIPTAITSSDSAKQQETNLTYDNDTWKVNASREYHETISQGLSEWINSTQYERNDRHLMTETYTVTYPNDYDGLCFTLSKKPWEYDREDAIKYNSDEYIGFDQEDVGKEILDYFDDTSKEDMLFYTLHDTSSISTKALNSSDEVESDTYTDMIGLQFADNIDDIKLPYKFFVINGSVGVLDDSEAPLDLGLATYVIGKVTTEEIGNGETKISFPYQIKYDADIDLSNSNAFEIEAQQSLYYLQSFDMNTGNSYDCEYNEDKRIDNSDWGDWDDDGHTSYHEDYNWTAEITIPTEKLDSVCFLIGDRYGEAGTDYIAFNMETALAHEPKAEKKQTETVQQSVEEYSEPMYDGNVVGFTSPW